MDEPTNKPQIDIHVYTRTCNVAVQTHSESVCVCYVYLLREPPSVASPSAPEQFYSVFHCCWPAHCAGGRDEMCVSGQRLVEGDITWCSQVVVGWGRGQIAVPSSGHPSCSLVDKMPLWKRRERGGGRRRRRGREWGRERGRGRRKRRGRGREGEGGGKGGRGSEGDEEGREGTKGTRTERKRERERENSVFTNYFTFTHPSLIPLPPHLARCSRIVSKVDLWCGGSLSNRGSIPANTGSYPLAPAHYHNVLWCTCTTDTLHTTLWNDETSLIGTHL